jgi:Tfp pilus assembly protein PilN
MYKFNFLSKINQEKIETRKRESFIRMLFLCFASVMVLLLSLLYLFGLSVNTDNRIAKEANDGINTKIKELRSKDFFNYRSSQNLYNSMNKRKKISDVFKAFEMSMDSTVIVSSLQFEDNFLEITFISRSSDAKSQLMSWIVSFKDRVEEVLIGNGICGRNDLTLVKGPDIRKQFDNFTYWSFVYNLKFPVRDFNLSKGNVK